MPPSLRESLPGKPRDAFPALDPEPPPPNYTHTRAHGHPAGQGGLDLSFTGARDGLPKRAPSWEGACPVEVPGEGNKTCVW